tara:strand:+ start:1129 stop:1374 length:246 start_codon:yes stop_codon:yes gene_type:complete
MRLTSDVERQLDGYSVMVQEAYDGPFILAPIGNNNQYVFGTFDEALEYGKRSASAHMEWKIIPFFAERQKVERQEKVRFSP